MEHIDVLDKHGNKTGKTKERGQPLQEGEYCHIVHVWIANDKGEFLISKRPTSKKTDPDKWEPTRGGVVAGEESLMAAVREVNEELRLVFSPEKGRLIKSYVSSTNDAIVDVWLFRHDVDISKIAYQPEEVADVQWATGVLIKQMMAEDIFITTNGYMSYLDELLHAAGSLQPL